MQILVSVFNNLATDQRVEKVCKTLSESGHSIQLIGNSWGGLPEMQRPYKVSRISLKSKILRYAYLEFNWKLYSELKSRIAKDTILVSNDLDTLLPNYLLSKKYKIPLVYDSHEIFTEMPSLQGRFVQKIWRFLEKTLVPKVKYRITACDSYARWYEKRYELSPFLVIQNFPRKYVPEVDASSDHPDIKVIMYQGTINPSRGLDKVIPVMQDFENTELWIAGNGPKFKEYQKLTDDLGLTEKVKFLGRLSPKKLRTITKLADVGLSIEENNGQSYFYSLPNKISDYIQARVPIVVSDFPEMGKIARDFEVGETIENHSPTELKQKISKVLQNGKSYYKSHLDTAAEILCWENEEKKLRSFYEKVVKENF